MVCLYAGSWYFFLPVILEEGGLITGVLNGYRASCGRTRPTWRCSSTGGTNDHRKKTTTTNFFDGPTLGEKNEK